jgi:hypothetical protein
MVDYMLGQGVRQLRIVPSALGDSAGVRGAAALVLEGAAKALALSLGT